MRISPQFFPQTALSVRPHDALCPSFFPPPLLRAETVPGCFFSYRPGTDHPAQFRTHRWCRSSVAIGTAFPDKCCVKARDPFSIKQTLCDVIDAISMDRAAAVTGRTPGYLRIMSDEDQRGDLTCRDAILLDAEYEALLGGRPLTDMMRLQIDAVRPDQTASAAAALEATLEIIRESGEAHAALIAASVPGATLSTRRRAIREILQSLSAKRRLLPILRTLTRRQPQAP